MTRKLIFIWIAMLSFSLNCSAQSDKNQKVAIKIKAIFIYNFANLVDWPEDFKVGDFKIGVIGNQNLFDEIQSNYTNKKVGKQNIKVFNFKGLDDVQLCDIIYVDKNRSNLINQLSVKYKSDPILLVTEAQGAMRKGSTINFVVSDDKLSYELSLKNADKRKLVIANTLLKLAHYIEE